MTTRRCNKCMLYYSDMIWSHSVNNCPFCGASIKESGRYEHSTPEEKKVYREINEGKEKIEKKNPFGDTIVKKITVPYAIEMYKRYRHNTSLLLDEKRYIMEAFWRHCELANECLRTYDDWLFNYYFSGFEV